MYPPTLPPSPSLPHHLQLFRITPADALHLHLHTCCLSATCGFGAGNDVKHEKGMRIVFTCQAYVCVLSSSILARPLLIPVRRGASVRGIDRQGVEVNPFSQAL